MLPRAEAAELLVALYLNQDNHHCQQAPLSRESGGYTLPTMRHSLPPMGPLILLLLWQPPPALVVAAQQVLFFGLPQVWEEAELARRRQLEGFGSQLSPAVNAVRDMANEARSPRLRESLLGKVDETVARWQDNQAALESELLPSTFPLAHSLGAEAVAAGGGVGGSGADPEALAMAYRNASLEYDDVAQVLHHVTRDWSADGEPIRRLLYAPLVEELQRRVPGGAAVVVPGSGLGRLALDLALAGLRVTGVEVSRVPGFILLSLY